MVRSLGELERDRGSSFLFRGFLLAMGLLLLLLDMATALATKERPVKAA